MRTSARAQARPEDVRGDGRVLEGHADPHRPDGRHRVGGVAEQQQAGPVPAPEAARLHGQERGLVPVAQRLRAVGQPRHPQPHRAAQRLESPPPAGGHSRPWPASRPTCHSAPRFEQRGRAAFAHVDPRWDPSPAGGAGTRGGRSATRCVPAPARPGPAAGRSARRPPRPVRPDLVPPVPGPVAHPADVPVVVLHQGLDAGAQDQPEGGAAPGLLDDQAQEAHLGHDGHERVRCPEAADVVERHRPRRRADREGRDACQRDREQAVGQAHLPQQVEHRRLQGVAAEVPVEVAVGLEQRDGDALPGQQQGQHRAGRPAADDAAVGALDGGDVVGGTAPAHAGDRCGHSSGCSSAR